jgi:hypothetical protein
MVDSERQKEKEMLLNVCTLNWFKGLRELNGRIER